MKLKSAALLVSALIVLIASLATAFRGSDDPIGALEGGGLGSLVFAASTDEKKSTNSVVKPPTRAELKQMSSIRRQQVKARNALTKRLATPEARRERAVSRTKYRDLDAGRAFAAVKETQAELIERPTNEPPRLKSDEKIVDYISPTAALVKRSGAKRPAMLEAVGAPIAAKAAAGGKGSAVADLKPIDLDLRDAGSSWRPKLPSVGVTLPKTAGAAATLGDELVLDVPGAKTAGRPVDGRKVFYGAALKDTDVVLEPAAAGLEISWVLRSPAAPESLPLGLRSQRGKRFASKPGQDGSVTLLSEGEVAATVSPAVAWDAQGKPVEATLVAEGGELSVRVAHAKADLAYPIVVDPLIRQGDWGFMREDEGGAPTRIGWGFHTFQPDTFWQSGWNEPHKGMAAVPGNAGGSAWQAYDPIRESSAFRVEFFGMYRDYGQVCITAGLYNRASAWTDSGWGAYWTSPNDPSQGGPNGAANSAFGNCWGPMGRTFIQVCAANCGWGGSPDNIAAFQMNTAGGNRPNAVGARFEAAYVLHREITPPVISAVNGLNENWTNGQLSATISADDSGIGFCSDRNFYPDPWVAPDTLEVLPVGASGRYGYGLVGGCAGMTHYMPAPSHVDMGWVEGQTGPWLSDGQREIDFKIADMFGSTAVARRTVRIDRTGPPTVNVGGRLSDYLTPPGPGGAVPDGIRTLFGPADITVDANDVSGAPGVSGVNRVEFFVSPLGAGGWGPWNHFKTLTGCSEGGGKVCGRLVSSEIPATAAGTYQIIVRAWDNAGNSRDVHRYFARGGGEISTVVEGQTTARWVPLGARRTTGAPTQATFKWRAAAAATPTALRPWADIPADALQREADGARLPNGTVPMAQEAGAAAGVMATGRYVLDLDKLITSAGITDLGNGKIQLRAEFNGTGTGAERISEDVSIRLDRGGRDTDDKTHNLGPGDADLLTGNFSIEATDAGITGLQAGLSLSRSYNSRYSADKGRVGPGWTFGVPADDVTEFARVVDLSDPARELHRTIRWDAGIEDYVYEPVAGAKYEEVMPAVEVKDDKGAGFVFERRDSDGAYLPEIGFEDYSLRRVAGAGDATARFELTNHQTGVTTTFGDRLDSPSVPTKAGEPEHGTFGVTGTNVPGVGGSPTWKYGTAGVATSPSLPVAVLASTTPGLDCSGATMPAGCQKMDLEYVRHAGSGEPRLSAVAVTMWDPATSQMTKRYVARYAYSADAVGRLTRVDDVRAKSFTLYAYDAAGLLSTVTEGAISDAAVESTLPPHRLTYTQFPEDKTPGRLRSVSRDALPGTATWTLAYGDRELGGANPWDLSSSTIAKWGQTVTPFRATAVFPPDVTVGTDQASLRKADISYLDALGRELNHAEPGGRISVTDYNKYGNVIRTMTPAARAKALLNTADTTGEANRLATLYEYETLERSSGGAPRTMQRATRVLAPLRTVKLASGAEVSGRSVTSTTYDEGFSTSDPAMPYNLPTTVRHGVLTGAGSNGSGGSVSDIRETKTEYQLPTRQPVKVIEDAGTGRLNSTKVTVRDALGREIERRQPGANASAAATTTKTVYYAPGAPDVCGTKPAWNGLVCRIEPGAQPAASSRPALPVKTHEYDYWLRGSKVTETYGSTTRTVSRTFDGRDRPLIEKIVGGVGAAVQTTKHVYDVFGREVETQKVGADDSTVLSRVRRGVDALGRRTSYEDADGNKRLTTYDLLGRVATESEWKGATQIVARSYGYDQTTGDATTIAESGAGGIGTITASYDADGRPIAVRYPLPGATAGEVTKSIEYGNDGFVSRQAYTKTVGCTTSCLWYENRVVRSAHEQIIDDISTGQTRRYSYDGIGRLTAATDKQGSAACVTRSYSFDANSNRTLRRSAAAGSTTAACLAPGSGGTTIAATYDSADRAVNYTDAGGAQDVTYDAAGRITKLPWQASGGTTIESSYFANDLVREIWTGPWKETNTLDPSDRLRTRALSNGTTVSHTDQYAYGDDTDEPMFIATGTNWRRYAEDMTGDVVAQVNQAGSKVLQIANIHGDTVGEAPLAATTTALTKTIPVDEFGVRLGSVDSFADRSYAYLGAKQRESIHNGAVVAMGVRTYSPWAGRFMQQDPVVGGSANAYDYASQDPVNNLDLDGRETCKTTRRQIQVQTGFELRVAVPWCAEDGWIRKSTDSRGGPRGHISENGNIVQSTMRQATGATSIIEWGPRSVTKPWVQGGGFQLGITWKVRNKACATGKLGVVCTTAYVKYTLWIHHDGTSTWRKKKTSRKS